VKSLVSGIRKGKSGSDSWPTDELLDGLNRLHRADEEVMVGIVEIAEKATIIKMKHKFQKGQSGNPKGNRKG